MQGHLLIAYGYDMPMVGVLEMAENDTLHIDGLIPGGTLLRLRLYGQDRNHQQRQYV